MRLTSIYQSASLEVDRLLRLHRAFHTTNVRIVRPEWRQRFFGARLVNWPRNLGLWRSRGQDTLVVGTSNVGLTHLDFQSDALACLLRSALVQSMAIMDKLIHEAMSKRFMTLLNAGLLDKLPLINLSDTYRIAQNARIRRGRGGRILPRPGHVIKQEAIESLYAMSFLSPKNLEEKAAHLGMNHIYQRFGDSHNPRMTSREIKRRWAHAYRRRNDIAHEADIIRQPRARSVQFHQVSGPVISAEIEFIKRFCNFFASEFDRQNP